MTTNEKSNLSYEGLSPESAVHIKGATPWMLLVTYMGFLGAAISGALGIYFFYLSGTEEIGQGPLMLLGSIDLGIAIFVLFINLYLMKSANNFKAFAETKALSNQELALKNMKMYFILNGIALLTGTLVVLSIAVYVKYINPDILFQSY